MAGAASLWLGSSTYPSSSTYPGRGATGDKVYPAATLYPGSSSYPGQGTMPMHELLMSVDDASTPVPSWTYVTDSLRSFTITRGRENELATVDAGTETITLDNRDRTFDPTYSSSPFYPNLRPMNRVWHRVRFAGETHDLFKGYVDSYDQQWPSKGADAITIVNASDEFKVLALGHLPTTDPPRESYTDVVQFDKPQAYWRMNNASETLSEPAVIGPELTAPGGMMVTTAGAIVGEQSDDTYNAGGVQNGSYLYSGDLETGQTPEVGGLTEMTFEAWVYGTAFALNIAAGPYITGNVNRQFVVTTDGSGVVSFKAHNGSGYLTATSSTAIIANQFAHVVGTISGSTINVYVNGVLSGTAAWTGTIAAASTSVGFHYFALGNDTGGGQNEFFDEVAVYRYGLTADRVVAHYNAGAARGFAAGQTTGQRVGAILDSVTNQAPRQLDTGQRTMQGRYMVGQDALGEMRVAEKAEAVDAMLFVNRRGGITFLDAAYRGGSSYAAPAITFSDDGTCLPYVDISVDYSEAYLANEWNVTFTGGTTVTSSDADSISRYFRRSQSLSDLAVSGVGADQVIADAMLAKYKDPMLRITSLAPQMNNSDVLEQVFRRDLGDRIRVIRTPINGQAAIDQQLFIQKIEISGTAQSPYLSMTFGVSPV